MEAEIKCKGAGRNFLADVNVLVEITHLVKFAKNHFCQGGEEHIIEAPRLIVLQFLGQPYATKKCPGENVNSVTPSPSMIILFKHGSNP